MNYEEAVAYIDETPKFTKKNSLDHTKECLRRLGNPQDKFKVIHVAGTNGKGSTCAFLTSVLREAGYSCGLFTSPHLVEINERFQINEVNIDNDTFLKAFEKVKVLADELVAEGSYHPTYFEMLFLMGMVIFAEAGVDYVTLETGLGGRMDATTAVENPVACVITSISLDHMQYLGDTVAKIAGEKAGIIVPGVPVIYDGNDPDAAEVIRARAEELGSPAYEVKRSDTEVLRNTSAGIDFAFRNEYYKDMVFSIPFIAKYQVILITDNQAMNLKNDASLKYDTLGSSNIQQYALNTKISQASSVKNEMHQIMVPNGKRADITFSDGTRIYINSGSKVIYPDIFEERKREILVEGEVYLDVAKRKDCPFVVKTREFDIRVLGTSFNVCAYREDEAASVVLVRGSVEVTTENKSKVRLAPNQLVDIKGNKTQVRKVDVSEYISWKDNLLLLHQRPVGDVLKKLERYYGCKIRYDAEITTLSLSGKLDLQTDITNVMDNLCLSLSLHYTINDKDEIYVSLK